MTTELKCCELCEAYSTCDHKGECCPECSYYDPEEHECMATHKPKPSDSKKVHYKAMNDNDLDVDEATFLFEDDDEEEDFEPDDNEEDFDYEDAWD